MIYVANKDGKTLASGHIGTFDSDIFIQSVDLVQADGDELGVILAQCRNLPFTTKRVHRWYGDHAKFIVYNVDFSLYEENSL